MPGPSTLPPLSTFADHVCDIADQIAADFNSPDDDFYPVMIAFPGDGSGFQTFALPAELLGQGERGKDILADEIMCPIIDAFGARLISWTMSAWILDLSGVKSMEEARRRSEEARRHGLRNHPDRREIVMINAMDAHDFENRTAEILRTETAPPTLGPWEDYKRKFPGQQPTVEGRFFSGLREALRDSPGVPNKGKMARLRSRGIRMSSI